MPKEVKVEFDGAARMRIVVDGQVGEFAGYHDIATLVVEEELYIAVTEFGLGCPPLKPETVYLVKDLFLEQAIVV